VEVDFFLGRCSDKGKFQIVLLVVGMVRGLVQIRVLDWFGLAWLVRFGDVLGLCLLC
jgi:hypothetical protein